MGMEVTKRETLLECLDLMKKFRACFSHKGMGMMPTPRYAALFKEYDEKCRILREMLQALESEPVRKALANWQMMVMEKGPEALKLVGDEIDRIDADNMNQINGPLTELPEIRPEDVNVMDRETKERILAEEQNV